MVKAVVSEKNQDDLKRKDLDFAYILTERIREVNYSPDDRTYQRNVESLFNSLTPYFDDEFKRKKLKLNATPVQGESPGYTPYAPENLNSPNLFIHTGSDPSNWERAFDIRFSHRWWWQELFRLLVALADRRGLLLTGRESKSAV